MLNTNLYNQKHANRNNRRHSSLENLYDKNVVVDEEISETVLNSETYLDVDLSAEKSTVYI